MEVTTINVNIFVDYCHMEIYSEQHYITTTRNLPSPHVLGKTNVLAVSFASRGPQRGPLGSHGIRESFTMVLDHPSVCYHVDLSEDEDMGVDSHPIQKTMPVDFDSHLANQKDIDSLKKTTADHAAVIDRLEKKLNQLMAE